MQSATLPIKYKCVPLLEYYLLAVMSLRKNSGAEEISKRVNYEGEGR